jgi:hypothetical protein
LKYKIPCVLICFEREYYLHGWVLPIFGAASIFPLICFCLDCFSYIFFVIPRFSPPFRGFAPRLLLLCIVFFAILPCVGFAVPLFLVDISMSCILACFRVSASICPCVLPPCLLDGLRPDLFSRAMTPRLLQGLHPDSSFAPLFDVPPHLC